MPFAMANRLVKIIPPASRRNNTGNMSMKHMENDATFINAIREARPCEQSPLQSALPAPVYINQTEPIPGGGNISLSNPAQYAVVGTTFYYANQINNSILGLTLPEVQIQANIPMHMALQYDTMSPGGGKTLLIGNSARSLLKVCCYACHAPSPLLYRYIIRTYILLFCIYAYLHTYIVVSTLACTLTRRLAHAHSLTFILTCTHTLTHNTLTLCSWIFHIRTHLPLS